MVVELISVGTELLMGNIVNSNARFLAEKCAMLGFDLYYQVTVGDNYGRMKAVIQTALERSDLILLTGGLGPTEDDLTKEACAQVMGMDLVEDAPTRKHLERFFANHIYRDIPENNWKMARVPRGATVLTNHNGMAPGLILKGKGKTAILLPGPPGELYPLFNEQVVPWLQRRQNAVLVSKMVKLCGYGESQVEDKVADLIDSQDNPTIATYAKTGEVHLRLTAKGRDQEEAERLIRPVLEEILGRFKESVYTTEEQVSLEMAVVDLLRRNELTISTAESCTGGMVSARLVNVSGASEVFMEGLATYSNEAKERLLGVRGATLSQYGAVSKETAMEMAAGGASMSGTHVCVSITGLAGPGGETDRKPVGLVYMACSLKGRLTCREYHFKGNRETIREQSTMKALDLVRLCILDYEKCGGEGISGFGPG